MKFFTKKSAFFLLLILLVVIGIILGPRLLREYRFSRYGVPERERVDNPFISGSEELKSCMKKAIGEKAFNDIAQDKRPPTREEEEKLGVCWVSQPGEGRGPFTDESEEVQECLRQALGEPAFEEIGQRQRAPTAKEEDLMATCFGQQ